ncbi:MAG: DUF87 domain-containing protein [Nitrososphaerota archaeon]|nr:DUF87 domain-containing protein [Aigarchaeota archaeon]MDW8076518.1 DUF87 domain-containing protein [Nitrososphaerota archaeon]
MKIFSKQRDTLDILAFPQEVVVEKGQYLLVSEGDKFMLVQVIDVNYADIPGILEDMLREVSLEIVNHENIFDPFDAGSLTMMIKEARIIRCKIRCVVEGNRTVHNSSWLPSRFKSSISVAKADLLRSIMKLSGKRKIHIGMVGEEDFWVDAESFDGRLTIITGKKETGKSHITKLISTTLVEYGALVIVLDINGEYVNLKRRVDGSQSNIALRHEVLEPGRNFRVSTEDVGLRTFMDILIHVYDTPSSSSREFFRIWNAIKKNKGKVTLRDLIEVIQRTQLHESVKEALMSRLMAIEATGIITDEEGCVISFEEVVKRAGGKMLVINLRDLLPSTRRMVVEYLLSKLTELLQARRLPPIFLVAEEAHLYLRDTYWDDVITRMRHLGLSPIFVTNQPDSIPETTYRQADNIILFNFTNEADLEAIAKTSRIDSESVKTIAASLPPRYCLLIGYLVRDIPVVVKVREVDVETMGKTRLFFELFDRQLHIPKLEKEQIA